MKKRRKPLDILADMAPLISSHFAISVKFEFLHLKSRIWRVEGRKQVQNSKRCSREFQKVFFLHEEKGGRFPLWTPFCMFYTVGIH
jgi:hypothetical protein